ncbi:MULTISPECIES: response regulator [Ensifer]|jgi:PAS domain S-box-containing protein|uniref:histidine kinase n=1 Tax=Ensifer adhaerens TaxID=106592 RepID=A0ABY8HTR1_ENSAD|nr:MULTISPECIES: response regulator [Ensifer]MBD9542862.1 response regulator [Ensifer sp. ENS04]OWZ89083.1 hybrid sensor histidine kinase/response regulator [Sinorhizobium sp. LM21]WFP95524.1 response regulator [Ensifer adhaerens]SFG93022.1 PAS domain S-box-containing protein [Ensifer sp. OV372]
MSDIKSLSREQLEDEILRLRALSQGGAALKVHNASDDDAREARYRALFEAIDDGFCIIGFIDGPHGPLSDYVHLEANSGYGRHTGISDIVGKRLREIEPGNADVWLDVYGSVLRTGKPVRFEQEFKSVARHIEVSATRIEPAGLRQVAVLFRDVTERKKAEAALRESESHARDNIQRVQMAMAAGAIIGTWLWDVPTDRFTVDEAFAAAFGFDPQQGRSGLSLADIVGAVHPDDQERVTASVREALAKGGAYAHQYRTRREDGRYRWLEANGRVECSSDGVALKFPGVLIDIEERRAVEAERDHALAALRTLNETLEQRVEERTAALVQAEDALRQAQKMEAVGQLTGGLAHDFNNILAGISGSLDLMKTRLAQGRVGEIDRYMTGAQGAVKRAAGLTQRLLAFSRRQTLDPKPSDINRIVAGMQDLISRSVGPGVAVETVGAGGLWTAFVDVGQLENALLNLCINARDAMPDGGRLTIETGNRWLDERAAAQRGLPPGQYVSLCVSDTGTGMSPDVVARAFDPFFTTKPIGQGTGLGLSMVYGFAGQSGGAVRIYSEVGKGTMICIYLPRHAAEDHSSDIPADAGPAPAATGVHTILVVDDEPLVRMVAVEILEELGYEVLEASDGPSALKMLDARPTIDLLVTDVGLPNGMNGRQLADAVRVQRPGLNVLFVTGYAENAVLNHGHLDHGMEVVTKPFTADVLARRVESLIRQ